MLEVIILIIIILLIICSFRIYKLRGGGNLADVASDITNIKRYFGLDAVGDTEVLLSKKGFHSKPVEVFIEFCYRSANDVASEDIRSRIVEILRNVMRLKKQGDVFIYREQIDLPIPTFEMNDIGGKRIWTAISLGNTFGVVNIPKTKNEMRMDEYLQFDDVAVQIEYSEGLSRHKSNAIEFLLRMLPKQVSVYGYPVTMEMKTPLSHYAKRTPSIDNTNLLDIICKVQNSKDVIFHFMQGLDLSTWKENAIMKYIDIDLNDVMSRNFLSITADKKFRLTEGYNGLKLIWDIDE